MRNTLFVAFGGLLLLTGPGRAEEANQLERMVISAGQEKVAIDTPQSVSVVNQQDLDSEQALTLGDALTDLPGVKTTGTERALGESFNIRGIGSLESADEPRHRRLAGPHHPHEDDVAAWVEEQRGTGR